MFEQHEYYTILSREFQYSILIFCMMKRRKSRVEFVYLIQSFDFQDPVFEKRLTNSSQSDIIKSCVLRFTAKDPPWWGDLQAVPIETEITARYPIGTGGFFVSSGHPSTRDSPNSSSALRLVTSSSSSTVRPWRGAMTSAIRGMSPEWLILPRKGVGAM